MDPWKMEPARDLGLPPGERLRSIRRESGLLSTMTHMVWWSLIRTWLRLGHRLTIHGREHLPTQAPFVMIANHASHLDAMVLAAPVPWRLRDRVFPIAAGDVFFETPAMSAFAAMFINALPMWRRNCGPHALKELRQRLVGEPCGFILFPEGGRSRDGTMLPFKAGLGMLVAASDVPVIPCYIAGAFEAMPPDCRLPRPRRLTLTVGPAMTFEDCPNRREGWEHITTTLRAAVERLQHAWEQ